MVEVPFYPLLRSHRQPVPLRSYTQVRLPSSFLPYPGCKAGHRSLFSKGQNERLIYHNFSLNLQSKQTKYAATRRYIQDVLPAAAL